MKLDIEAVAKPDRIKIRDALLDAGWRERITSTGVRVYEHPVFGELEEAIIKRAWLVQQAPFIAEPWKQWIVYLLYVVGVLIILARSLPLIGVHV